MCSFFFVVVVVVVVPQIQPGEFRTSPGFEGETVPVTSRRLCQEMEQGSFSGRRLEITPPL